MIAGFSATPGAPIFWFRRRGIQVFSTTRAMQRDDAARITDPERCVAVCAVQNIHGHSGLTFAVRERLSAASIGSGRRQGNAERRS